MGMFQPIQSKSVKVIRCNSKPRLNLGGELISPPAYAHTGCTKGVKGAKVVARFHQPIVLQGISKEHHRTCSGWSHCGIEESRARTFCWPSWHVSRPFLVFAQVNECLSFKPKVAGGI